MDNAAAEISTADQGAQARQPELIVDWPSEEARRIVTLRILPARQDRLAGRALRQGLAACGFRHGQFGIFHLAGEDGRVVISAASLVRPGMLDPTTMDFQRFAGINVFAVLPGPVSAEVALQQLAQVAVEVAARVGGRVQDETCSPFSAGEAGEWRQRCLNALEGAPATARQAD
jgi:cell division protein ZipA